MSKVTKRPTAKSKIKKPNRDFIESQLLSQSSQEIDRRTSLPRDKKHVTKKTLVKQNQSIFTPNKDQKPFVMVIDEPSGGNESSEDHLSSSESSELEEIEESTQSSQNRINRIQPESLTTYETKLPKSTANWKPLPVLVFNELKTLLTYLLPDSLTEMSISNQSIIHKNLMNPLFKRMQNISLPSLTATELDLSSLEDHNKYINDCYDSSLAQLDDVIHQSLLEKSSLENETKYLAQFKKNVSSWKTEKNSVLDKLKVKSNFPNNFQIPSPSVSTLKENEQAGPVLIDNRLESLLSKLDSTLDNITLHTQTSNSIFKTLDRLSANNL